MGRLLGRLSLAFSAGCIGGAVTGLAAWWSGQAGVAQALGVKLAPALTLPWFYQRVVWGGIWGLLFVLPLLKGSWFLRGLLFSVGPTLAQLFYFFPEAGKGQMGLSLGALTPAFVVFFNAIWGLSASLWFKASSK